MSITSVITKRATNLQEPASGHEDEKKDRQAFHQKGRRKENRGQALDEETDGRLEVETHHPALDGLKWLQAPPQHPMGRRTNRSRAGRTFMTTFRRPVACAVRVRSACAEPFAAR